MKLKAIRPKAPPATPSELHQIDVKHFSWRHRVSEDIAKRIAAISRTIDQADAIAELMK